MEIQEDIWQTKSHIEQDKITKTTLAKLREEVSQDINLIAEKDFSVVGNPSEELKKLIVCDVNRYDPMTQKSFSNGHKKVSKLTHCKMR